MKKTIVVFGSSTGMTEEVAGKIADKLGTMVSACCKVLTLAVKQWQFSV